MDINALATYAKIMEEEEKKKKEYVVRSCNEMRTMPIKPFPWLAKNIIPERALTIIAGKTGCGKSLISFYFADRISKGRDILDNKEIATKQVNVLYIEMEMTEDDNLERVRKVCQSDNNLFMIYEQSFKLSDDDNVNNLLNICRGKNIRLIFFDTFSKIHLKDENSNSDMTQIMDKLATICRENDLSIVCLHHYNKNNESTGYDKSRGASSIVDNCASFLEISSKPDINENGYNTLSMTIKQHKSRRSLSITEFGVDVINLEDGRLLFQYVDKMKMCNDAIQKYINLIRGYVENHPGLAKSTIIKTLKENYPADKSMTRALLRDCVESLIYRKEIIEQVSNLDHGGGKIKKLWPVNDTENIKISFG